MNDDELNQLEMKLRSWRPRRPSARLKFKLAVASGKFLPKAARYAGWLAPAVACILLAVMSLSSENDFHSPRQPMMAMIFSNESYMTFCTNFNEQGENSPPQRIFKWTNAGASPSSMRFTAGQNN